METTVRKKVESSGRPGHGCGFFCPLLLTGDGIRIGHAGASRKGRTRGRRRGRHPMDWGRIERMRWINCRSTWIWVRMTGGILLIYSGDVLTFKEVYRYPD